MDWENGKRPFILHVGGSVISLMTLGYMRLSFFLYGFLSGSAILHPVASITIIILIYICLRLWPLFRRREQTVDSDSPNPTDPADG